MHFLACVSRGLLLILASDTSCLQPAGNGVAINLLRLCTHKERPTATLAPILKFSVTGILISSPLDIIQLVQTKHIEDALPEC